MFLFKIFLNFQNFFVKIFPGFFHFRISFCYRLFNNRFNIRTCSVCCLILCFIKIVLYYVIILWHYFFHINTSALINIFKQIFVYLCHSR